MTVPGRNRRKYDGCVGGTAVDGSCACAMGVFEESNEYDMSNYISVINILS